MKDGLRESGSDPLLSQNRITSYGLGGVRVRTVEARARFGRRGSGGRGVRQHLVTNGHKVPVQTRD